MFFWQNRMSHYALTIIDRLLVVLAFSTAYHVKLNFLGPYSGLSSETNYFIVLILYFFYAHFVLSFLKFSEPTIIESWFRELAKIFLITVFSSTLVIITCYLLHFEHLSRLLLSIHNFLLFLSLLFRRFIVSNYSENVPIKRQQSSAYSRDRQ